MGFRSSLSLALLVFLVPTLLSGCLSYQLLGGVEGAEVPFPCDRLEVGKTTLGEALVLLGAPDKLDKLEGQDFLVYERAMLRGNRLSLGIPIVDVGRLGIDLSAYGGLVRYDRLVLSFTPDGILINAVFEQGSTQSYWKALAPGT